ncbi:hypothetical protein [Streptomyces milbemycinicus]|uniref:Uncharacterized protein n=1 Tax=Streptomyces milbemycinicus TaxID=476552 RepID=A0ABW8LS13_9ACTN
MLGVTGHDEMGVEAEEVLLPERGLLLVLGDLGLARFRGRRSRAHRLGHGCVGVPVVAVAHVPAGVRVGGELWTPRTATAGERADGGGVDAQGDLCQFAQEGPYGGVQYELGEQSQPSLPLRQVVDVGCRRQDIGLCA